MSVHSELALQDRRLDEYDEAIARYVGCIEENEPDEDALMDLVKMLVYDCTFGYWQVPALKSFGRRVHEALSL